MKPAVILLCAATFAIAPEARSAGEVNLCETDVQGGGGPGALNLADAVATGGRITFACPAGTVLSMTRAHVLTQPTEIDGGGRVTLDAHDISAMFDASAGASPLVLRNITLRDGPSSFTVHGFGTDFAGLIFGPVALFMTNVNVEATRSPIAARSVEITGGKFSGNTGTVIRSSQVRINGAEFSNNEGPPLAPPTMSSVPGPSGLAIGELARIEGARFNGNGPITWRGRLEIKNSSFINNGRGASNGGALWIEGQAVIEKTEFINNQAVHGGAISLGHGSLQIRRGIFTGNKADHSGGAIAVGIRRPEEADPPQGSTLHLSYSKFERNSASFGGAILLGHRLVSPNSLSGRVLHFAGNSAEVSGGAISSLDGSINLGRVVFVENKAGVEGGAINAEGLRHDTTRLGNALIVRNVAPRAGGYLGSRLEVLNSTITGNHGGAIRVTRPSSSSHSQHAGELRLKNTVLDNNDGGNCPAAQDNPSIVDEGNNIQHPGNDCGGTVISVPPELDSLYVPSLQSPARLAGDNQTCVEHELVAARDVYGESRPQGSRCTIGAVEGDLERHVLAAARRAGDSYLPKPIRELLATLGIQRYPAPTVYEK